MRKKNIQQWIYQEAKHDSIKLPGITETTRNVKLALDSSKCILLENCLNEYVSVLFVFLMKNYNGFDGFRLTEAYHTPYP